MKDLHSNISIVKGLTPQTVTSGGGAVNTGNVDLQGFNSAEIEFSIGANLGDTLNVTNKFTVALTHADDNGAGSPGDYANVEAKDVLGVTPATGVVFTIDDATEDELVYRCGYVGGKRFIKVTVTPNGTLTSGNPIAVNIVKGHPSDAPTS